MWIENFQVPYSINLRQNSGWLIEYPHRLTVTNSTVTVRRCKLHILFYYDLNRCRYSVQVNFNIKRYLNITVENCTQEEY